MAAAYEKGRNESSQRDDVAAVLKSGGLTMKRATNGGILDLGDASGNDVFPDAALVMAADTGAENHAVARTDEVHVVVMRKCEPVALETANGITRIEEEADTVCGGIAIRHCLFGQY